MPKYRTSPFIPFNHLVPNDVLTSNSGESTPAGSYVKRGNETPGSRPPRRQRRKGRWLRRLALAVLTVLVIVAIGAVYVADQVSAIPGNDDWTIKLAEWGRDHNLGIVVTTAENLQYRLHPPTVGGIPNTAALSNPFAAVHAPMTSPAVTALAGVVVFTPAGNGPGRYLIQTTMVRPDAVHTSYLTGVAWMSHKLLYTLHPGYQEPGAKGWTLPDYITPRQERGLQSTFNSGFKLKDAEGGFYDHGKYAAPLVNGAASMVIYTDGHAVVGTWGKDVSMTPQVAWVRQNLKPLIQDGQIAANIDSKVQSNWGATVGGDLAVWRSGIGVTNAGDLVYAAGDAMTVSALADVLKRAGAVQAMQLDINKAWVSYMTYTKSGGRLLPKKLVNFQRPADRYLVPANRDFFAAYAPTKTNASGATPSATNSAG